MRPAATRWLVCVLALASSACSASLDASQMEACSRICVTINYTGVRAASQFPDYSGIDASILERTGNEVR
jgi:hypothetical protein